MQEAFCTYPQYLAFEICFDSLEISISDFWNFLCAAQNVENDSL